MYEYKAKECTLLCHGGLKYSISQTVERTYRIRYEIQKTDKPPSLSVQLVPTRRTFNMSLVTFHINICYNTTSERITALFAKFPGQ